MTTPLTTSPSSVAISVLPLMRSRMTRLLARRHGRDAVAHAAPASMTVVKIGTPARPILPGASHFECSTRSYRPMAHAWGGIQGTEARWRGVGTRGGLGQPPPRGWRLRDPGATGARRLRYS